MAVIKGVAMWAALSQKNQMSGKYQMDLCRLDRKSVETLEGLNIPVKKDDNDPKSADYKGYWVSLKSDKYPPKVVDAKKNLIPDEVLIGNGSVVKVVTSPYAWKFKNKKGVSANLGTVQVLKLVEYKGKATGLSELEEEDGFVFDGADPEDKTSDEELFDDSTDDVEVED